MNMCLMYTYDSLAQRGRPRAAGRPDGDAALTSDDMSGMTPPCVCVRYDLGPGPQPHHTVRSIRSRRLGRRSVISVRARRETHAIERPQCVIGNADGFTFSLLQPLPARDCTSFCFPACHHKCWASVCT